MCWRRSDCDCWCSKTEIRFLKQRDRLLKKRKRLYRTLLQVIAHKLVPPSPDLVEPRVKKLRPKAYGWMQQPRAVLKRKLAA